MQETWVRSLGREDSLEKKIATHSSILAWRIPWTEESGGLQSMRSQRVGHVSNLSNLSLKSVHPSNQDPSRRASQGPPRDLPHLDDLRAQLLSSDALPVPCGPAGKTLRAGLAVEVTWAAVTNGQCTRRAAPRGGLWRWAGGAPCSLPASNPIEREGGQVFGVHHPSSDPGCSIFSVIMTQCPSHCPLQSAHPHSFSHKRRETRCFLLSLWEREMGVGVGSGFWRLPPLTER